MTDHCHRQPVLLDQHTSLTRSSYSTIQRKIATLEAQPFRWRAAKAGLVDISAVGDRTSVAILVSEILDLVSPKDFGMT